jgi:PhnB protein
MKISVETFVNAQPLMVTRFDESPDKSHPMPLPPNWGNKIMHCGFTLGQTLLMASDGMSADKVDFSGVNLSITADDEAQARRLFDALQHGGKVFMPMSPTFWSPCFGMRTDPFGVNWMVGVDGPSS